LQKRPKKPNNLIKSDLAARLRVPADYVVDCETKAEGLARGAEAGPLSPEDEAALMLGRAEKEAEALVEAARREVDDIRTAARTEGSQAAEDELNAAVAQMEKRWAELEAEVKDQVGKFWATVEPELLKLAVEIAGKIVRQEIDGNREFIVEAVKAGLHQLTERQNLKIRVNPSDYQFVCDRKSDLLAGFDATSLDVIEDRRVGEGGWVIESENGHLDGKIDTQLREVERTLLETCHNGGNQIAA